MSKTFRPYDPNQAFLMPASLQDWLPKDHLAYFISDVVDHLDLGAIMKRYEEESDIADVNSGMPADAASAIKGAIRKGRFDGGIELYHYVCRYFAGDPKMIKDAVQKEFDLSFLVLEGDPYDSRYCNAEQLRTRIESFAEMLLARRSASRCL